MMKNEKSSVWLSLLVILLLFGIFAGALTVFKGNSPISLSKNINEDNLITIDCLTEMRETDQVNAGMKIKWNDDGSFVLSGRNDDPNLSKQGKSHYEFAILKLTEGGRYTLNAGNKDASDTTFGVYAVVGNNTYYTKGKTGTVTFDVPANSEVKIGWFVHDELFLIYEKLAPSLAFGEKAITFYE